MAQETLQSYLADRILLSLEAGVGASDDKVATLTGMWVRAGPQEQALAPLAHKIADALVAEALRSGLPLTRLRVDSEALGGGNTAELVERVVLHAPFVFKLDSKSKKLAEEALAMRKIKGDPLLPARYRAAWPTIYAVRQDAPYAYLMEIFPREEGWSSLEDLLYPKDPRQALPSREVEPIGSAVLDLMFEGFEASLDVRSLPNLETDYVGRIAERLQNAAEIDERFRSRPLLIRGQLLRPWAQYLAMLKSQRDAIGRLAPKFRTITHGDPNPGNLMLRLQGSGIEIKFIDPKEWVAGDYLFDIAKLTHFLEGTGPVEKPAVPGTVSVSLVERTHDAALNYQYAHPEWTGALVQACYSRASAFATKHGDEHWEARYELAMASNLLGLPLGGLTHKTNPRPESALILYAEGLRWLDRFCQRLDGSGDRRSPFVVVGKVSEVEPHELAQARALVRQHAPQVRDAVDHRGFRLLHWLPARPDDKEKPRELSLEHEARLKPGLEPGLHRLLNGLHESNGRSARERVLPNAGLYGDLLVEHVQRESGAQSVDHYYDVDHRIGHRRLIPRMFSLRQRLRTSSFMSWSVGSSAGANASDSTPVAAATAALNLELPFVALGSTGMTARLEFNWLDDPQQSLAEASSLQAPAARLSNPIFLASLAGAVSFEGAAPVIEHTTFREKFLFKDADGQPRFALNIDRVTVQSLATGRMASYVDVDISGFRLVDEAELVLLTSFCLASCAVPRRADTTGGGGHAEPVAPSSHEAAGDMCTAPPPGRQAPTHPLADLMAFKAERDRAGTQLIDMQVRQARELNLGVEGGAWHSPRPTMQRPLSVIGIRVKRAGSWRVNGSPRKRAHLQSLAQFHAGQPPAAWRGVPSDGQRLSADRAAGLGSTRTTAAPVAHAACRKATRIRELPASISSTAKRCRRISSAASSACCSSRRKFGNSRSVSEPEK